MAWKERLEAFIGDAFESAYQCEKTSKGAITQAALSDWMSDRQQAIRSDSLERLAENTGISPSWLLLGKGPRHVRDLEGRGEVAESWKAAVLHAINEQIRAKHRGHSSYTAARTADHIAEDLPSFEQVVSEVATRAVAAWEQERLSPLEQQAEALRTSLIERIECDPENSGAERDNLVELDIELHRVRKDGGSFLMLTRPIDSSLLRELGPHRRIRRVTAYVATTGQTTPDGRKVERGTEFGRIIDPDPMAEWSLGRKKQGPSGRQPKARTERVDASWSEVKRASARGRGSVEVLTAPSAPSPKQRTSPSQRPLRRKAKGE